MRKVHKAQAILMLDLIEQICKRERTAYAEAHLDGPLNSIQSFATRAKELIQGGVQAAPSKGGKP